MSDVQAMIQRIASGDADGQLTGILEAVQSRVLDGAATFQWQINWDGLEISENDLTLDEALSIEAATGATWSNIEPLRSAAHCKSILKVCMMNRMSLSSSEVDKKLSNAKVVDILNSINRIEVNPSPLA